MPITQKQRLARAWHDTDFRHPKRLIAEGSLVAAATYAFFQYSKQPREAISNVTEIVIAVIVGAVAIPVCEFLWNYARAPLAIELDALRTAAGLRTDVSRTDVERSTPQPALPTRTYLKERAGDIVKRLNQLKWHERELIVEASYAGQWLRESGVIIGIMNHGDRFGVLVWPQYSVMQKPEYQGATIALECPAEAKDRLRHLAKGDHVAFHGRIKSIDDTSIVTLNNVEFDT
jgi:hypothetical protein